MDQPRNTRNTRKKTKTTTTRKLRLMSFLCSCFCLFSCISRISWFNSSWSVLLVLAHAHVAEGHRAVVALQQQRPRRRLLLRPVVTRRRLQFDVLVNQLAVERRLDDLRVLRLLAVLVEARRQEDGRQLLPLAGLLGRVLLRGDALVEIPVLRFQLRARVDAATVVAGQILV